jgi:hypothetical protein
MAEEAPPPDCFCGCQNIRVCGTKSINSPQEMGIPGFQMPADANPLYSIRPQSIAIRDMQSIRCYPKKEHHYLLYCLQCGGFLNVYFGRASPYAQFEIPRIAKLNRRRCSTGSNAAIPEVVNQLIKILPQDRRRRPSMGTEAFDPGDLELMFANQGEPVVGSFREN